MGVYPVPARWFGSPLPLFAMSDVRAMFRVPLRGWIIAGLVAVAGLTTELRGQGSTPPDGLGSYFRPLTICFPLNPPPLGRPITKFSIGLRTDAPAELAAYVNEPFYAPLSTWLMRKEMPAKYRARVDAFRNERAELLGELRAEIARTRIIDPPARRAALMTLAKKQDGRLTALEASAEQLRGDLVTSENDWSALREWRLGGTGSRGDSPMEIACVMRAYAYYQAGLSPAQRRLLREIMVEVYAGAEDATSAAAAQPFLFFMPEMTRILMPDTISDDVAKAIATFQTKKSVLKKELFDAVLEAENASFGFSRTATLRTLAGKQAARFAEVEKIADEIRDGIVALPELGPSLAQSPLSPALSQRTVSVAEERANLMRDSRTKIEAILARVDGTLPVKFSYTLDSEGIKVQPRPIYYGGSRLPKDDPRVAAVVTELTQVGNEHRTRNEELMREYEQLRVAIADSLGPKATGLAVDQALDGVVRAYTMQENEAAYAEYRIAAFEPGLSPAQRRLLFEGALEKLELPLPRAEYQPTRRPDGW